MAISSAPRYSTVIMIRFLWIVALVEATSLCFFFRFFSLQFEKRIAMVFLMVFFRDFSWLLQAGACVSYISVAFLGFNMYSAVLYLEHV
jgi:hypothetical protein